mmetsp:Transcript_26471/g.71825  ORF Transcript_26471/g.71825 Transcript_26471/m.71825 type:complete len:243 (+) Transcript_26471:881-1609(+)
MAWVPLLLADRGRQTLRGPSAQSGVHVDWLRRSVLGPEVPAGSAAEARGAGRPLPGRLDRPLPDQPASAQERVAGHARQAPQDRRLHMQRSRGGLGHRGHGGVHLSRQRCGRPARLPDAGRPPRGLLHVRALPDHHAPGAGGADQVLGRGRQRERESRRRRQSRDSSGSRHHRRDQGGAGDHGGDVARQLRLELWLLQPDRSAVVPHVEGGQGWRSLPDGDAQRAPPRGVRHALLHAVGNRQ